MGDYLKIFRDAPLAAEYRAVVLEGIVPHGLRGSLLRNGPGIQRIGRDPTHLLDGYGFIGALTFDEGGPFFRGRHVQTPLFLQERSAGRQLFRKPMTNLPGRVANLFNVKLGNPAGHDVYAWAGKIYAAETSGHFALNPKTLETEGPAPLNVHLTGKVQLSPMPRVDPATNRLISYSAHAGVIGNDAITFYEHDTRWNEVRRRSFGLPGRNLLFHDHAFTPNHYVVIEFGRLKLGAALLGRGSIVDAVGFDRAHPLRLFVLPRDREGPIHQIRLPPGHQHFHIFNAFERDAQVVVDAVFYKGRIDFHDFYPPQLKDKVAPSTKVEGPFVVRHTLDLLTGQAQSVILEDLRGEAPAINPANTGSRHRFGYAAAPVGYGDEPAREAYYWFHGVVKIDFDEGRHQTWSAGPRAFCSPPVFVARPDAVDEDDGWLLIWVLDAATDRSQVVVLDAKTPAMGPIARLGLKDLLPAVSHAEFAPPPSVDAPTGT